MDASAAAGPVSRAYVRLMAGYNGWMNGKVYDACASLSAAELHADRGAFFRSVIGTLNHLLYGDLAWFGRFKDGAPRAVQAGAIIHAEFAALRAARESLDREISAWSQSVSPAWLAAPFTYRSTIDGRERTFPAWMLVAHMFNHQTHHRGQLTTLLTQLGRDVGPTDMPFMPDAASLVVSLD
ncbi:MAG: damage-inducible protein DinB [Alphaproteobacteria bacterium]|nr:damage-inducible protein DinB [Alphaproteobacteria bacterium]